MRVMKSSILAAVLTAALSASSFAQTAPPAAPKPAPPAAQAPAAPKPSPPLPFPADSKIAFIDVNMIAGTSSAGKEASKRLTDLTTKKTNEIGEKNKQLQALTAKRDTGIAVLNDAARAQLDKDIDKLQRDIQFAQTNAQAELQDLQNELQGEFQKRLIPIIEEVAKEKGLHAVFSIADSGAAFVHAGLNISDEVVKRLDALAARK